MHAPFTPLSQANFIVFACKISLCVTNVWKALFSNTFPSSQKPKYKSDCLFSPPIGLGSWFIFNFRDYLIGSSYKWQQLQFTSQVVHERQWCIFPADEQFCTIPFPPSLPLFAWSFLQYKLILKPYRSFLLQSLKDQWHPLLKKKKKCNNNKDWCFQTKTILHYVIISHDHDFCCHFS